MRRQVCHDAEIGLEIDKGNFFCHLSAKILRDYPEAVDHKAANTNSRQQQCTRQRFYSETGSLFRIIAENILEHSPLPHPHHSASSVANDSQCVYWARDCSIVTNIQNIVYIQHQ